MYDCGTPLEHCTGSKAQTNARVDSEKYRAHGDADSARRCQKRYLREENKRRAEAGEPTLLGSKPFRLKRGKNRDGQGSRWMPPKVRG